MDKGWKNRNTGHVLYILASSSPINLYKLTSSKRTLSSLDSSSQTSPSTSSMVALLRTEQDFSHLQEPLKNRITTELNCI